MKNKENQCNYIFRSEPLLPNIKVGGCISMGRCPNKALPEFVVCFEHANKEALWMQCQHLTHKLEKLEVQLNEIKAKICKCNAVDSVGFGIYCKVHER